MGITCRVYCHATMEESHVKLGAALVTAPLPSQVNQHAMLNATLGMT